MHVQTKRIIIITIICLNKQESTLNSSLQFNFICIALKLDAVFFSLLFRPRVFFLPYMQLFVFSAWVSIAKKFNRFRLIVLDHLICIQMASFSFSNSRKSRIENAQDKKKPVRK